MRKNPESDAQMPLPGDPGKLLSPATNRKERDRISHVELLRVLQDPSLGIPDIAVIYRQHVLSGKTRSIHLLGHKSQARIQETLLGYEVKAEYKRIQCPDMVTARYLKLFTELGCRTIRLPYDPTVTAALIPELERAVAAISRGVLELFPRDRQQQLYVLRKIYSHLRARLKSQAPPLE